MPIGPSLPPHLAHLSTGSRSQEPGPSRSPSPDDYGPALPPHLAAARVKPAGPTSDTSPVPASHRPSTPGSEDGDDSDDGDVGDVIGPIPGALVEEPSAVQQFIEREARWAKEREESAKPKKPQREEWMLTPPTSGVLSAVDPLRKRPTQFSKSTAEVETDSTVWTETPLEKARRLADEVAGIKRKKNVRVGAEHVESVVKRKRDEAIREGIDRHNKEQRGASLLDQHAKKPKHEEAPVIWDHDRDMGITGRLMSDTERQSKISEARGLNDRFGHSKRGAFDM